MKNIIYDRHNPHNSDTDKLGPASQNWELQDTPHLSIFKIAAVNMSVIV